MLCLARFESISSFRYAPDSIYRKSERRAGSPQAQLIQLARGMQQPMPLGGNLVCRERLMYSEVLPPRTARTDLSRAGMSTIGDSNEYSACTTWLVAEGRFYLIDNFRRGSTIRRCAAR